MTGELIKSFLVGLGFDVDNSSLSKFNKSIADATLRVTALAGSISAASLGVDTGIASISKNFEQMGYELRIITPTISKVLLLRREMLKAYAAAGVNITKVVQQSVRLNLSLNKTKFAFRAIYESVASRFFPLLTKQSDLFRKKLYQFLPKIQSGLEEFINILFKAFYAVLQLGERAWSVLGRLLDFFISLHKATNGWSTVILGAIAAWKLLNLSFLATPLGLILSLGLAILALYDDFKTFQEGGKSLINWSSELTRNLEGLAIVIGVVAAAFATWGILSSIVGFLEAFNAALAVTAALEAIMAAPLYVIAGAVIALIGLLDLLDQKWNLFGGHVSGFFSSLPDIVSKFVPGAGNVNTQATAGLGQGLVNPIGSQSNNNSSSFTQHNKTDIHVQGSADANAIGRSVGNEQSRVSGDLTRNFLSKSN